MGRALPSYGLRDRDDEFEYTDVTTIRDHAADSSLKPLKEVRPAGDERVGRPVPTLVQLEDEQERPGVSVVMSRDITPRSVVVMSQDIGDSSVSGHR